jgi:hypothetical protein
LLDFFFFLGGKKSYDFLRAIFQLSQTQALWRRAAYPRRTRNAHSGIS